MRMMIIYKVLQMLTVAMATMLGVTPPPAAPRHVALGRATRENLSQPQRRDTRKVHSLDPFAFYLALC
jgi:hypothetical protein